MADLIRVTISVKISPSHEVIHLACLYTTAKQFVVNQFVENNPQYKNDKELLNIVRHEWCEKLKEM